MVAILKIISFLNLVVQYLPTVIKVVQKVESLYKEKDGKEKKRIAMDLLDEALNITSLSEEKQKEIVNFVSGLIDAVVSFLNLKNAWENEKQK
ncbi:hypothetical protein YS40_036 [Thermus phage phiYS40]|uniref:hypothetical protein n=1 Tax=Thermus phage phiYS40 TaxID=407392 RepID=UPI0000E6899A|nr:hypothetical protein YS40_036 [Thermus phage phiYS40]ABJ91430.1 hypothetical protein YS40_036 [Thermus phage phiYS40]BAK53554.1 hypothetical protein YSP_036 [Thermus phage phiYS40]